MGVVSYIQFCLHVWNLFNCEASYPMTKSICCVCFVEGGVGRGVPGVRCGHIVLEYEDKDVLASEQRIGSYSRSEL